MQSARTSSKVYEEKLKFIESEKSRIETKLNDSLHDLKEKTRLVEGQLNKQITELKGKLRITEDQLITHQISLEKECALKD